MFLSRFENQGKRESLEQLVFMTVVDLASETGDIHHVKDYEAQFSCQVCSITGHVGPEQSSPRADTIYLELEWSLVILVQAFTAAINTL